MSAPGPWNSGELGIQADPLTQPTGTCFLVGETGFEGESEVPTSPGLRGSFVEFRGVGTAR
jgi:hypothetical protein